MSTTAYVGAPALLRAMDESLARGHWRVACRRYLMLLASGVAVAAPVRERCDALLERCSLQELVRMRKDAQNWASMLAGSAMGPLPGDRAARPVRTEWRPLPKAFSGGLKTSR